MAISLDANKCPKCGTTQIKKSKERNLAELFLKFMLVPCRCYNCEKRFFRPRWYGIPPDWPSRAKSATSAGHS